MTTLTVFTAFVSLPSLTQKNMLLFLKKRNNEKTLILFIGSRSRDVCLM